MDFALIETLRYEPVKGFVRRDLHLERLEGSAAALGFTFDRATVLGALEQIAGSETLRVRLELAGRAAFQVTAAPFVPHGPGTVWRVAIAATRLDSADPLLRHKTTRRDVYARARAEFPANVADEVILLNETSVVCEGTITNLFMTTDAGGPLLTPPLSSGLLPGVLRRELLDSGAAREAVLSPGDLAGAAQLYCGNSLRGLIPAVLA